MEKIMGMFPITGNVPKRAALCFGAEKIISLTKNADSISYIQSFLT